MLLSPCGNVWDLDFSTWCSRSPTGALSSSRVRLSGLSPSGRFAAPVVVGWILASHLSRSLGVCRALLPRHAPGLNGLPIAISELPPTRTPLAGRMEAETKTTATEATHEVEKRIRVVLEVNQLV